MNSRPEFIAIVGPTGTGKSALALDLIGRLAEHGVAAEVINADAMQFYKGMNIGTAKLGVEERRGIKHHLLDWLEVTEESTAANYQKLAREKVSELVAGNIYPIIVGGSMLYLASLINTFEFPGRDEGIRADLESQLESFGSNVMHEKLRALDEIAASRIEPSNGRRIVRAMEIVLVTGQPFSASLPEQFESYRPNLQIGLNSDRGHLVERLAKRVDLMWEKGLLEEVSGLLEVGLGESKTARQAIGYAQALSQLEGKISEDDAISQTTMLTQRYARRQMSWFRRDARILWHDYQDQEVTEKVCRLVFSQLEL